MNRVERTDAACNDQRLIGVVEEITFRLQSGTPCDEESYLAHSPEYADRL